MSILSIPVFNSTDPEGALLGTLQIDSDLPLAEIHFDEEETWQRAERFADVASFLMEVGR